jgi:hypothetical protein
MLTRRALKMLWVPVLTIVIAGMVGAHFASAQFAER